MDIPVAIASGIALLVLFFVDAVNLLDSATDRRLVLVSSALFFLAIVIVNLLSLLNRRIEPSQRFGAVPRCFRAMGAMLGFWIKLSIPVFPLF